MHGSDVRRAFQVLCMPVTSTSSFSHLLTHPAVPADEHDVMDVANSGKGEGLDECRDHTQFLFRVAAAAGGCLEISSF